MTGKPDTWLILTPGFPKDESDSTCLPLQQALVKAIQKDNPAIQLIIISFQYPFERKEYQWNGIRVIAAGGKNKGGLYRRLTWRWIKQQLHSLQVTNSIKAVLSFWCGETALVAKRFAAVMGARHYCWICGQDAKADNKLVKKINPGSKELVALSNFIADEFERNHGIRPASIIPPGIDITQFRDEGAAKVIDLLAAGSLIPLKQFEIFIELVAALKDRLPGLRTAIAGEGPERKKLEKLIAAKGLGNTILLTGELPHTELLRLMQRTRIFIHPSAYEGFGVVNIEALYAGAHVISFVQPMKKEIPNWHTVATKEEMVEKAIQLLKLNPARVPAHFEFTITKTATGFIKLLNEASQ